MSLQEIATSGEALLAMTSFFVTLEENYGF